MRLSLTLLAVSALCACGPSVEEARKTFPPISKDRPLGTKCSTTDSASLKRAPAHPLNPTGGWLGKGNSFVDYDRTMKRDKNHLELSDGCISGYVRFAVPGYLRARSYDDYFGDVYCGWSPLKVDLKPTSDFVFVSLDLCSVGDGGLDQVHEVAWFPQGTSQGILIFSTAYKSPGQALTAADTYRRELLGNSWQFNDKLAQNAAIAYLARGDLPAAKRVIEDALAILAGMKDATDGQGRIIPAFEIHRNDWASMLSYKLGMSIGTQEFDTTLSELRKVLETPSKNYAGTRDSIERMLPLYVWFNDLISGKKSPIPSPQNMEEGIVGHEPKYTANYLLSKMSEQDFVRREGANGLFWLAVKRLQSNDTRGSAELLQSFLKEQRHSTAIGFEIAAAANMRRKLLESDR